VKRARPARWYYYCQHNVVRLGERSCQSLRADAIGAAVSDFVVAAVNRQNIALALSAREQMRADFAAIDRQRINRIEALRHEADLARRRFMAVDPGNRLVATSLLALNRHSKAHRRRHVEIHSWNESAILKLHSLRAWLQWWHVLQMLFHIFPSYWPPCRL